MEPFNLLDAGDLENAGIAKRQTLAKWRVEGGAPPFIKVGRLVKYDPADVRQWLNSRKVASTSEAV